MNERTMPVRQAVMLSVGCTLLSILGTLAVGEHQRSRDEAKARPGSAVVTSPDDFATVGRTVMLTGTVDAPKVVEKQLWVVVRVNHNNANTYYPQGPALSKAGTREWTCHLSLGSPDPSEDNSYTVITGFVAPPHTATLSAYVRDELDEDVNGMEAFDGSWIDIKDSRTLQRAIGQDESERKNHKRCQEALSDS